MELLLLDPEPVFPLGDVPEAPELPVLPAPDVSLLDPEIPVPLVPLVDPEVPIPLLPLLLDPDIPVPLVPLLDPEIPPLAPLDPVDPAAPDDPVAPPMLEDPEADPEPMPALPDAPPELEPGDASPDVDELPEPSVLELPEDERELFALRPCAFDLCFLRDVDDRFFAELDDEMSEPCDAESDPCDAVPDCAPVLLPPVPEPDDCAIAPPVRTIVPAATSVPAHWLTLIRKTPRL